MAFDQYGVEKVGDDPEVFWMVFADSNPTQGKPFMKTSTEFSETDLREELTKMGLQVTHIDTLIARACAKWNVRNTK